MVAGEHSCKVCGYVRSEHPGTNRGWHWCRRSKGWVCGTCCMTCSYNDDYGGIRHCKWDPAGREAMRSAVRLARNAARQAERYRRQAAKVKSAAAKKLCYERMQLCRDRERQHMEEYEAYYRGDVVGGKEKEE